MAEEKEKKPRYHAIEKWMLKDPFFNAGVRLKIYMIIRGFTLSGKTGKCFYSLSDFEENTCLQRRTICRAIEELQANGYIIIEKDGRKNTYKSLEKINNDSDKLTLDKLTPSNGKKIGTNCHHNRDKLTLHQGQIDTISGTNCHQHPNSSLIGIKLNTNNKAVNICLLDNTPSQSDPNLVTENGEKEETETAEKDTANTADGKTAIRHDGNNGCPTPSDNNPSLSLTDNDKADTADGKKDTATAKADTATATKPTEDKDREILDRILTERPLEEIVTDKLLEIYPQGKVDLNREEILFRLKNIAHLEEETVYLLTLVKETMDINPYYVPKLSRYLDQGSYLQHYRVRLPLEEFSADYLAKKEWEGKMTKEDWKEAGDLLLREFDLGGNGFHDPLPEPSEEEKKEALAWLDSMGKAGSSKR